MPKPDEFVFERDMPVRELVELVTGEVAKSDRAAWKLLSQIQVNEEALRLFGWAGLCTLLALTRRGDRKAAQTLVELAVAQPARPLPEAIQELGAGEAAAALYDLYRELGLSERDARAKVESEARAALASDNP